MENIVLLSGNSNEKLAQDIADGLGVKLCNRICDKFSNTEIRIKINENIRNKDIFIIQTGTFLSDQSNSINDYLMEALIMIDAAKRSMVNSVTLVMPCYPYSRQDKKEESREPITAKLVANLLCTAGIDRLIVMDLHAPQIQGFFDIRVDNLYSLKLVLEYLEKNLFNGFTTEERMQKFVVVSPDAGATRRTLKFAKVMKLKTAIMHKQRDYSKTSHVEDMLCLGKEQVKGKTAIIMDDMCDTAGTLCFAAKNLVEQNGALEVICVVTHGVLSGPAIERIEKCHYITRLIVSDTIPQEINAKKCSKIEVFSVAEMIAEVIRRIYNGESLSNLFCEE